LRIAPSESGASLSTYRWAENPGAGHKKKAFSNIRWRRTCFSYFILIGGGQLVNFTPTVCFHCRLGQWRRCDTAAH
jgi:hypothetical protein